MDHQLSCFNVFLDMFSASPSVQVTAEQHLVNECTSSVDGREGKLGLFGKP
jgi:hypothetical protein